MPSRTNALGEYVRARRAQVDPQRAGFATGGRRVSGLRREELALVAGISSAYLTRLEQGVDRHPSLPVVTALAEALGLDGHARAHLFRLAGVTGAGDDGPTEEVSAGLRRLMAGWVDQPAVVVGRYRDVLAANPLAQVLNRGFEPGRNLVEHTFVDPDGRTFYAEWDDVARGAVAALRASAGAAPDDARLRGLIDEVTAASPEFAAMWAQHEVRERVEGSKRYHHPEVGSITLSYETFTVNGAIGQTLFVFHAEPGSADEQALALLAKIAAG